MAKSVVISQRAATDIDIILSNVIEFTGFEISGIRLFEEFSEKFDIIQFMPEIGRLREDGTRETFARNYRIIYEEIDNIVYILTVIHCSRLYPT
ncbi:plasmid stabilization system protein [Gallibacterium genomosp. 3]|uniref:Plasmid stabilization system protein n=1 Tax=Gallibacterium genomosp. 3 TaxID=505345 RepID=A0A1A7NMA9_9PAST|nr:type II toxin-antitoxin system RelE/ParE family toxin [Gallibacterium genomosp. 3]OBW91267.1 plasmid stabilization system protein [Gallibacterium genomosp. 3]